jgi:hypothetical protein
MLLSIEPSRVRRKISSIAAGRLLICAIGAVALGACGSAHVVGPDGGTGGAGGAPATGGHATAGAAGIAGAAGVAGVTGAGNSTSKGGSVGTGGAAGMGGATAGTSGSTCPTSTTGGIGVLGCPCSTPGALACNGNAQKVALICSGGAWAESQICPSGQLCDTATGVNQGTCMAIDPLCTTVSPGTLVCASATTVSKCGSDNVSDSVVQTCSDQACVSGACQGACKPGSTQCSSGGVATCSSSGQWGAGQPCSAPNPVCLGGACVPCSPSSTQCSGSGVATCGSNGQWGTAQACGGSTPVCNNGGCVACIPGSTQCCWQNGNTIKCSSSYSEPSNIFSQTCNAQSQWVTTENCTSSCPTLNTFVCDVCSGTSMCVPANPQQGGCNYPCP